MRTSPPPPPTPPQPSGWTEDHLVLGGRRVFYRRSPDVAGATPVVHVHGFGISGRYLMPTARLLAERTSNVVPDLPGYGRSDDPEHTLGIPALADALLRFLDGLGLERVVLLGNSMGCPISLEVAHRASDRVEGVVLVSPAGGANNQPLAKALQQMVVDAVRERPALARVAVPDYVRFGLFNSLNLLSELTRFPSLERLVTVPVPALAVVGSRDPLMPRPPRVREISRLAPSHATVVLIEGAAHAVNFSHPGELAHVVGSWLDGVPITDDPDQPGLTRVLQLPS
ncbi:alpha/beta fold hydrolase [Luteimicrobium subarcticum]|uniref:Pimeloyl-ACP methyl ester carboxylesterase n=1 Tax=Luteimicrobium subarcticum TaxID=620910 RepID=A0A2M8WJP0_9MICO|nr:alpha/beta hydrolase [Luteimicrobium subarcticum]PJI91118.1 pimeloyl-ACP methyl ester carboxylesterase [Luteimicrobium subarcticum]